MVRKEVMSLIKQYQVKVTDVTTFTWSEFHATAEKAAPLLYAVLRSTLSGSNGETLSIFKVMLHIKVSHLFWCMCACGVCVCVCVYVYMCTFGQSGASLEITNQELVFGSYHRI